MRVLLQVDFVFSPDALTGAALPAPLLELADSINREPGFVWKVWTFSEAAGRSGGIYLFENRGDAEQYLAKHWLRLSEMGATDIRSFIFDISEPLSLINHAPIA
ncbi:monooxygenase [Jeongeupia chitinilytica]|uniref:Monooxygenase n=1 Tax=Jeongeupia chitinilytica TaxID=1041641 RepID=A0ABQ3GZW2_9NEIS|nr:monooxygenase [Jeongeupia chitinilytica]GHD61854.1 monooxygenase [Jeongeupia chitinilytica]